MKITDQIEEDLRRLQFSLVHDIRDLEYRNSISDFMGSIRNSDFTKCLFKINRVISSITS